jgi:hypothetical protein
MFYSIIEGILGGKLEWGLVVIGALIAVALELAGVPALPVAVGMYIPLGSTTPIFIGGLLRWLTDRLRGVSGPGAATETSPGVLLASGYIAGGTLCGLVVAFFNFSEGLVNAVNLGEKFFGTVNPATGKVEWHPDEVGWAKVVAVVAFALLAAVLIWVGSRKPDTAPREAPMM